MKNRGLELKIPTPIPPRLLSWLSHFLPVRFTPPIPGSREDSVNSVIIYFLKLWREVNKVVRKFFRKCVSQSVFHIRDDYSVLKMVWGVRMVFVITLIYPAATEDLNTSRKNK